MAHIERAQNIDTLIGRVGAKLDLTITTTSTPNREQTVQWINDGALLLARLLPPHRLGGLQADVNFYDVRETADIDVQSIMRVVSASKYGVECTILSKRDLVMAKTRTPLLSSREQRPT